MISKIFSTKIGASPIDGSSSMSSFGLAISARPIAHICCSPPDIVPAFWFFRSARRGKSSNTRSIDSLISLRSFRWNAPISRFSITLMRGNSRRPSGDWLMPILTTLCGESFVMSLPWNEIVPRRGWLSPLIERSVVDLPAPFAPIRVTISPSRTSIEIPFSASIEP